MINMNRGFSLFETIIYISLLSILMMGVFSSVLGSVNMNINRPTFKPEHYQLLISNFHENSI